MGLIKAIGGAIRGTMADQWKEYFYCDAMEADVLVTKGQMRKSGKFGTSNKGNDNIISNGSVIAVNEGQCMIIVDQWKVGLSFVQTQENLCMILQASQVCSVEI